MRVEGLIVNPERQAGPEQVVDTPHLVIDNFLPADLAWAMRRDIEEHFAEPYRQSPETHQVWTYWFVPGLYTYLKTSPEKIFRQDRMQRFFDTLRGWSQATLGLGTITWPVLSLYVAGCRQGLHNDALNGRIAYVYSLTSDVRRTQGGQTLVFKDADPLRANLATPATAGNFYTAIEPFFNRLVLFDDRMPHAVEQLTGSMDPLDGRFVMHGHISEGPPIVTGGLSAEAVLPIVGEALNEVFSVTPDFMARYHGPLCLDIVVEAAGSVRKARPLLNRVVTRRPDDEDFGAVLAALLSKMEQMTFPQAHEATQIILPVMLGGVLPFLAAQGAGR